VALWAWNVDTDRIVMDALACTLWGIDPQDTITFEELSARIHPADLDKVRAAFAATRELIGQYETDFRILVGPDVRWISSRGKGDDQGIQERTMHGIFLDVTVRKRAEEARELVSGEMQHRIKNFFSIVHALVSLSARATLSKDEMARDLAMRLGALANAHALIHPAFNEQKSAVRLDHLLAGLLAAYDETMADQGRVLVDVPDLLVGETSITSIALVLHELATNSTKYGALGVDTGKISIAGSDSGETVTLVWTEAGGPPPRRRPKQIRLRQRAYRAGHAAAGRLHHQGMARQWRNRHDENEEGAGRRLTAARAISASNPSVTAPTSAGFSKTTAIGKARLISTTG